MASSSALSGHAVLEARHLHKSFGALEVTRDVSLCVGQGERWGIVGPNGSGKTTLFNLLSGELTLDRGQILIGGEDVTGARPDQRARLGLTRSFQKNNLFNDLSVAENLAIAISIRRRLGTNFWRRFRNTPRLTEEAEELAGRMGLSSVLTQLAGSLPYGTQRQLELALAIASRPKVLLLDEPTAGMSPDETKAMTSLIMGLPTDTTILIIEHDMSVLFEIVERIVVLDYGSVLAEGAPHEIRNSEAVRRRYFGES